MARHLIPTLLQAVTISAAAGKSALLLIDVQDCFLEKDTTSGTKGSLDVPASHIIPVINKIREKDCLFDVVVRTQDFHPANHISFASTHGLQPFAHLGDKGGLPISCLKPETGNTKDASCCPTQHVDAAKVDCNSKLCPPEGWSWTKKNPAFVTANPACKQCAEDSTKCFDDVQAMWTDHCLQTGDSTFPPSLTKRDSDVIVQKGGNVYVDAYSAFMDNSQNLMTALDKTLQDHEVDTLYVAGIATDVCVRWTVRDALGDKTGKYKVYVIDDASAGLAVAGPGVLHKQALAAMKEAGAMIVNSTDVLAGQCSDREALSHSAALLVPIAVWVMVLFMHLIA